MFNRNSANNPDKTPDFLPNLQKSGIGVRRLNKNPLIIGGFLGFLLIGGLGYTYQTRLVHEEQNSLDENGQKAEPANAMLVLEKAPTAGMIEPTATKLPPLETEQIPTLPVTPPPNQNSAPDPYQQAQYQQWEQRQQQMNQIEQARQSSWQTALGSGTTVFNGANKEGQENSGPIQGKVDFLGLGSQNSNYLPGTRMSPISPYEIKAGTVIPSVMLTGINSQLPGQILAQVSENVFDSATGRHLLIPQGSKLVGTYDNQIISGQNRVLIAWNRVIYPDASSLDLGAMPGSDQAGYAGFHDRVNNHVFSTFRSALFLSIITAGIQLSQPRAASGDYSYSSQQIVAGSLGQQMGQLGMGTIQKGLNVAPTITIRPGYRFNVMLNKDAVLPLWQGNQSSSLARRD